MAYYILNQNFENVALIDVFESMLWTDRYSSPGDFELYTSPNDEIVKFCIPGYYVWNSESEHVMIIENLKIESNAEQGNHISVTGRSLESLLDRRIIWDQTQLSGNLQQGIKKLINDAIISPAIPIRNIPNFDFIDSTDTYILEQTFEAQYTGDSLLTVISEICDTVEIGFKITLSNDNRFQFQLYNGIDRTYEQSVNPYVIFSPRFENVINSNYLEAYENFKNVALVAGEDNGADRRRFIVGEVEGLERKELYVDARDIQSEVYGNQVSPTTYNANLEQRGKEKLTEHQVLKSFEGQMETTILFKYGKDFYMGDVVQIENEYGMNGTARVIEFIWSYSTSGYEMYPTFKAL